LIYDQPVVLMQRQAGVAIEGMVRQQSSGDLERLAVDTHGFTYFAMAIAKVLSFDLCPRLKGLRRQKLHVPAGTAIPSINAYPDVEQDITPPVHPSHSPGCPQVPLYSPA
jgi:TnpA family transposase